MSIIDSFFERTAKINLDSAIDYAFNLTQELLKKHGIEDRDTLKTKLLEYATQQGGNEESLKNFATNDKLITFMKRMLMDMPKATPPVEAPKEEKPVQQQTPDETEKTQKSLIDEAADFIANEIEVWMPAEKEYYATWAGDHTGLINEILDQAKEKFSNLNLKDEVVTEAIKAAYWRVIRHEERLL